MDEQAHTHTLTQHSGTGIFISSTCVYEWNGQNWANGNNYIDEPGT